MEITNTETIVRLVEAGLGVSIVPLMASGVVTQGRRVSVRPLAERIRPIDSGVLIRRGDRISKAARQFIQVIREVVGDQGGS